MVKYLITSFLVTLTPDCLPILISIYYNVVFPLNRELLLNPKYKFNL